LPKIFASLQPATHSLHYGCVLWIYKHIRNYS